MASVLGKMDTIDIRVRPGPISSIVTSISRSAYPCLASHRRWRIRRACEGVRGIDILDLPVTTGLVASGVMWYSTRPPGFSSCLVNVAG